MRQRRAAQEDSGRSEAGPRPPVRYPQTGPSRPTFARGPGASMPSTTPRRSSAGVDIIGQLSSTQVKLDFANLLRVAPSVRDDLKMFLENCDTGAAPTQAAPRPAGLHSTARPPQGSDHGLVPMQSGIETGAAYLHMLDPTLPEQASLAEEEEVLVPASALDQHYSHLQQLRQEGLQLQAQQEAASCNNSMLIGHHAYPEPEPHLEPEPESEPEPEPAMQTAVVSQCDGAHAEPPADIVERVAPTLLPDIVPSDDEQLEHTRQCGRGGRRSGCVSTAGTLWRQKHRPILPSGGVHFQPSTLSHRTGLPAAAHRSCPRS